MYGKRAGASTPAVVEWPKVEVEPKPRHLTGVFSVLKQPGRFEAVQCDQGFVSWPDEIDLAPDARVDEIKARGRWVLE